MQSDKVEHKFKEESYFDAISSAIETLEKSMQKDKEQDLWKHREEIKSLLEEEIISRYKYETGRIRASLRDDKDMQTAFDYLLAPSKYKEVLSFKK